jgi:ATP/maltotriose-dependent transcriptional regulator MalT
MTGVGMESLTNREREVVALVAHGLSNDGIDSLSLARLISRD